MNNGFGFGLGVMCFDLLGSSEEALLGVPFIEEEEEETNTKHALSVSLFLLNFLITIALLLTTILRLCHSS